MILSDTHDVDVYFDSPPHLKGPPEVDVVLHCGDLTQNGGLSSYEKVINMLHNMKAELKLVIAGNHDVDLDKNFFA